METETLGTFQEQQADQIRKERRAAGLKEIESAKWSKDDHGCLKLVVHDSLNQKVTSFLVLRPPYCDRGHIHLLMEGNLDLDHSDSFPRYFFSFAEADHHVRTFLKWRLWKERTYAHGFEGFIGN